MSNAPPSEVIEFDEDASLEEQESALGDDSESYTTSLKSSILQYKFENGRRYHAEIKDKSYWMPNDEKELDRLDLYHHVILLRCDGKLHFAPISNPQRILDIGSGTGIWAIEMADAYPSAQVIGNDISPVQPSFVPPNVTFEIDDAEEPWLYSRPFDYIHVRAMAASLKDWPRLIRQAFQHTAPGGWVEFLDFDMHFHLQDNTPLPPTSPLTTWCAELIAGLSAVGMDPEPGPQLEGWVRDAGFVGVVHNVLPMPTGTWPKEKRLKEVGALDLVQFVENLEGISLRTLMGLRGWGREEVEVLLAGVRGELKERRGLVHDMHVVYAQKPRE